LPVRAHLAGGERCTAHEDVFATAAHSPMNGRVAPAGARPTIDQAAPRA
jgi:hypothetical protein